MTSLSIIVPALDEAGQIVAVLARLAPLRQAGAQVILADGGSTDRTVLLALPLVDLVVHAPRGRALQMNAGAAQAGGAALLFLHADTVLPEQAGMLIAAALRERVWGRFDIRLAGSHRMLPVIAAMMNWRSRMTGIATGDQAIFVRRDVFERLGGYAPIALMEDIELSRRLKKISAPACLRERVTSSGRRWEKHGVWRTIVLMWRLRLAYFLGADPRALAIAYGYSSQ
ncbi:MAG: TIGR04283 family arsenosugar biosynthesis glycosyltransferase [Tardiphaga sp.]|uniref:TIGR04283 family arsenosugar biosynthesis glycosyltransferase n=1 Tax=Tardiphaga sp. TaxID=1926292 RepID=UPI0019C858FD|nr:TIGR04283 family arsenosugar biosynthesis glycosyltransferase [Tardiphaga sp.]MBC7583572.1 TIGR04283 family arsenosugar biosynthesis glycosyltransferase [Tardiphaga sp.]